MEDARAPGDGGKTNPLGSLLVRLLRAVGAGLTAAVAVAITFAIIDLYLTGHSIAVPLVRGRPLHTWLGDVLVVVVPLGVAAFVFWSEGPKPP